MCRGFFAAFTIFQNSLQGTIPCAHKQCRILAAKAKAFHKPHRRNRQKPGLLPDKIKFCDRMFQRKDWRQKAFGTGTQETGKFYGTGCCRTVP